MKTFAIFIIVIFAAAAIWLSGDKDPSGKNSGGSRPAATSTVRESVPFGPNSSLDTEDQLRLAKERAREFLKVPDYPTIKGPRTETIETDAKLTNWSSPIDLTTANDFTTRGIQDKDCIKVNEGMVDAVSHASLERNYVCEGSKLMQISATNGSKTEVEGFGSSVVKISFKAGSFEHAVQVDKIFR